MNDPSAQAPACQESTSHPAKPVSRPDACVVIPHRGGIFSLFNKVITCMEIYPRVEVSFPPGQTFYRNVTEKNLWEVICHPLRDAPLEGEHRAIVMEYPHLRYTGSRTGHLYKLGEDWRQRLHGQFQKIEVKTEVLGIANSILPESLHQCVAVLHRGEKGLAREQLTGVLPSVDDMCQAVNAVSKYAPVFVCADSDEAAYEFHARLGGRMLTWDVINRVPLTGQSPVCHDTYGSGHVRNMFARTLAMSRTAHLIHPVSNIATAMLYMNPKLTHTFVEVTR